MAFADLRYSALYTQKHNRFVSLRAGSQRETLITQPFVVTGDSLQLNVDASRGRLRVGIPEYKPVPTLKDTTYSLDPHLMDPTTGSTQLIGVTLQQILS